MPDTAVIGLDLGGTKLAGAVFTPTGKILAKDVSPLAGRKGREVGELICGQLERLLAEARSKRVRIVGIGISVPGISHVKTGTVWAPNIPGWEKYPLRRQVQSTLGKLSVPLFIEGDRACYVLGEAWRGVAKGCRNVIFLAVGTGIGAGILIDGHVVHGAHDIAGAIGWLALDRPFRKEYVGCGCFEYHASGTGLVKVANQHLAQRRTGNGRGGSRRRSFATAQDVFAASERGDRVAREVICQAVEFWGMAVANLVSLFNPEKIIFGGGVFGPARKLLQPIYTEARKWAQPVSITKVMLQVSKLGGDAGLSGAAWLALPR